MRRTSRVCRAAPDVLKRRTDSLKAELILLKSEDCILNNRCQEYDLIEGEVGAFHPVLLSPVLFGAFL